MSSIYFRADHKNHFYSLEPYKISDLLGDLGGYQEIIFAVGVVLTVLIVENKFESDLMKDAYQVQAYNKNRSEYYYSNRARETAAMIEKGKNFDEVNEVANDKQIGIANLSVVSSHNVKVELTAEEDNENEVLQDQVQDINVEN